MRTFFNILQTLIGINNKIYPDDPFIITDNIDNYIYVDEKIHIRFLINTIHYKLKESKKTNLFYKNAFTKLSCLNSILENTFYKSEHKDIIFTIFSKAQKHYFAFTKLVRLYKIKKNSYVVTDDLMMNPLDPYNRLTFTLIEHKSNYLFNINELIKIIETAISNSPDFFSEPLTPLNPYNKQPFTNATLYNIYFHMKKLDRVISQLFHCFFIENFNKTKFVEQHEPLIREYAIQKYVLNSPHNILYPCIMSMIQHNYYTRQLNIHKDFPKDFLVEVFRPFLFYEYICKYYIKNTSKYYNAWEILHIKLKKFYQLHKEFGRLIIKLTKINNKVVKREYMFNKNYTSFHDIYITPMDKYNDIPTIFTNNSAISLFVRDTFANIVESEETYITSSEDEENNEDDNEDDNEYDTEDEEDNEYDTENDDDNSIS